MRVSYRHRATCVGLLRRATYAATYAAHFTEQLAQGTCAEQLRRAATYKAYLAHRTCAGELAQSNMRRALAQSNMQTCAEQLAQNASAQTVPQRQLARSSSHRALKKSSLHRGVAQSSLTCKRQQPKPNCFSNIERIVPILTSPGISCVVAFTFWNIEQMGVFARTHLGLI